jgi:predicted nucleic acid-binding protein
LYPAPLRDLLVRLAMTQAVRAHWTDRIHDEWTRNLLANRPDLEEEKIERTRRLMDAAVPGATAPAGHERRIDKLRLPGPDDRHVLAAAIEAEADVIVTFNVADFPFEALHPHGVRAATPDDFVLDLLEASSEEVVGAARRHRAALSHPPKSVEQYLATLRRQRLERAAKQFVRHADQL